MYRTMRLFVGLLAATVGLVFIGSSASALDVYLRADETTVTMPGGEVVTMWGYARDSSFGALDGVVTAPGPTITLPPGDSTLRIYLDNNLSTATSVVLPGQIAATRPVRSGNGRVRSFARETPPGNTGRSLYQWTNVRPGTCLYMSGTHPAMQVQMGLYGAVVHDFAAGQAYSGVPYDNEVLLLYSEVDPDFHAAVASNNYGPNKSVTSPIDYAPVYYLVNGKPYEAADLPTAAGNAGGTTLIRFLNAGLNTHSPMLLGMRMQVVAEDAFKRNHSQDLYSLLLPAGKTADVIVEPAAAGTYPLFDRVGDVTNAAVWPGGLVSQLSVAP